MERDRVLIRHGMITNNMEKKLSLDYSMVARHLGMATIIGMGESTHGTHEFFQTKTDLFKELVQNHGFNTFFLESIDDSCAEIDRYIKTGDGQSSEMVNRLFYVYRTTEMVELVDWLRRHYVQYPVRFIGIDERRCIADYASSYDQTMVNLRDKRMAQIVKSYVDDNPGTKGVIWAHDSHVAAYINPPEFVPDTRHVAMGENLKQWFGTRYYSVAQLFGSGYFNAALIDEAGNCDNSKLVPLYARGVSKWFWENRFVHAFSKPTFVEGPSFGGVARPDEALYKRALGWGVQRSVMHDQNNVTYIDIGKAFDAIIFYPRTTASNLLAKVSR